MPQEEVLIQNLKLIAALQPELAEDLVAVKPSRIHRCKTRNDEENIYVDVEGKKECYHSSYNAAREAENWFSALDLEKVDVLYVYGIGMGHYYDAAMSWLEESSSRYLVFIEDDIEVLRHFVETEKASVILKNLQVMVRYIPSIPAGEPTFYWLSWFFVLLPLDVSALSYYSKARETSYVQFKQKLLHDSVRKDALAAEFMRFSGSFFNNFYNNLQVLPQAHHGNKMFGKFKGTTAIICGAGPSLDKNGALLKNLSEDAIIFAGSSSLNALREHGVTPHFAAGIDPNPPQYDRMLSNHIFEVPFFYRGRMFHDALDLVTGPKMYVNGTGGYYISKWFEEQLDIEDVIVDEGYNVLNFCVEIARNMGCSNIIFVGLDLAYTDMKLYGDGVITDSTVKQEEILQGGMNASAFMRPDMYGNPVYTLWKWVTESEWIGQYAQIHPEVKFVNATEGGIGMPGIENMSLEDAMASCERRPRDFVSRIHAEVQEAHMEGVTEEAVCSLMEEMGESLDKCVEICDGMLEEIEILKGKAKKNNKIQPEMKSGQMELYEFELTEEAAYEYVLQTMTLACTKMLERQYYQVRYDKELRSDLERNLKRYDINAKKITFLREASRINRDILDDAIKNYKKHYNKNGVQV
jgi:hypothetical protein